MNMTDFSAALRPCKTMHEKASKSHYVTANTNLCRRRREESLIFRRSEPRYLVSYVEKAQNSQEPPDSNCCMIATPSDVPIRVAPASISARARHKSGMVPTAVTSNLDSTMPRNNFTSSLVAL